MKVCKNCGTQCDNSSIFCFNCGTELSAADDPLQQNINQVFLRTDNALQRPRPTKKPLMWAVCIGALALVSCIAVFLYIYFSPINRFSRALENGNYLTAYQIYAQSILGNFKEEAQAKEKIDQLIIDTVEDYINQKISYDNAKSIIEKIGTCDLPESKLSEAQRQIKDLNNSRNDWQEAQSAYGQGNYEYAFSLFGHVIPEDPNYEEAVRMRKAAYDQWKSGILSNAADYVQQEKYDSALALFQEYLWQFEGDEDYMQAIANCQEEKVEYEIRQQIVNAEELIASGNFELAFSQIEFLGYNYGNRNSAMTAAANLEASLYQAISTQAQQLYQEGGYASSAALLSRGLALFQGDEDMLRWHSAAMSHIPISLSELDVFDFSGGMSDYIYRDKYLEDNYANSYASSFYATSGGVTFLLNYKYKTFSGVVASAKGHQADVSHSSAQLEIYAGDTLLFSSGDMNNTSPLTTFELDVSGYERITLQWTCKGGNIWKNWGYFAMIFDGNLLPIPIEP